MEKEIIRVDFVKKILSLKPSLIDILSHMINAKCKSMSNWMTHYDVIINESLFSLLCSICGDHLKSEWGLKKHMKSMHSEEL